MSPKRKTLLSQLRGSSNPPIHQICHHWLLEEASVSVDSRTPWSSCCRWLQGYKMAASTVRSEVHFSGFCNFDGCNCKCETLAFILSSVSEMWVLLRGCNDHLRWWLQKSFWKSVEVSCSLHLVIFRFSLLAVCMWICNFMYICVYVCMYIPDWGVRTIAINRVQIWDVPPLYNIPLIRFGAIFMLIDTILRPRAHAFRCYSAVFYCIWIMLHWTGL